jgi:xanthine permease XanP
MRQDFYGVDEPIPLWLAFTLGLQHVLGMFVGIITPPLLVGTALGLPLSDTGFLVSMSLFTSGLTTLVQVARIGPVGSGLLSVTGPSFAFVGLAISTGKERGLSMVFGLALAGSLLPITMSFGLQTARRLFPPVVTGTAIALIGFSLIKVGFSQIAGIPGTPAYGCPGNFALGGLVIATIVLAQAYGRGWMRSMTIALGLIVGYSAALATGQVHLEAVAAAGWVHLPLPLKYGLAFDWSYLLPWLVAYLLVALECIGDLTATSAVSRQPVQGPLFESRLRGGLLADGLGCILTSFFNAMPKTTFAQNNGIIAMTGVAWRRVGMAAGCCLAVLGLFPKLAALISVVPHPVLGGATLMMFATVATAGLQIVNREGPSVRNQFILAVSLALGMGVTMTPEALEGLKLALAQTGLPRGIVEASRVFLESGMAVGTLTATVMNLILPVNPVIESAEQIH